MGGMFQLPANVQIAPSAFVAPNAVLHVDEGFPVVLGRNVTVGHRAVVHGATVGDNCIIGIGAILLNGCKVGANSIVGAGALLLEGREYPPNVLLLGSPAKVARELTPEQAARVAEGAEHYVEYGAAYAERFK
jgi:carbonic anhydrase/acetyltransferase-like protein (isoleucine patch superfamily)